VPRAWPTGVRAEIITAGDHIEVSTARSATMIGRSENHVGDVSGFAPPGDIHRVYNTGEQTAVSIHVYGTDVTRIGSLPWRYHH
jgi:3-mercaptopropionate dioxygenase